MKRTAVAVVLLYAAASPAWAGDKFDKACLTAAASKYIQDNMRFYDPDAAALAALAEAEIPQSEKILAACGAAAAAELLRQRETGKMDGAGPIPQAKFVFDAFQKAIDREQNKGLRVSTKYAICLDHHTRVLALASNEPAETIVKAAQASCWGALAEVAESISSGDQAKMEASSEKNLLLTVMSVRAKARAREPPPAPPASALGTPL